MRFLVKVCLVVILSFCGVAKAADSFGTSSLDASPDGSNAADVYRAAIAAQQQLSPADQAAIQKGYVAGMTPDAAQSLHVSIQPIMDLLRKARSIGNADWGPVPSTQEMDKARGKETVGRQGLSRLTHWEATYLFKTDPAAAVNALAIEEAIGRTDVPNALNLMVQAGIRVYAIRLLDQHIADIPQSADADIRYIVDPHAVLDCVKTAFVGESAPDVQQLAEYNNPATHNNSYIQKQIESGGLGQLDPKTINDEIHWEAALDDQLPGTFAETEEQFEEWMNKASQEVPKNPISPTTLLHKTGVVYRVRLAMVYSGMLDAALALEWGQKGRAASIIDPCTLRPFIFKPVQGGTEIDSPMRDIVPTQVKSKTFDEMFVIPKDGPRVHLLVPPPMVH
jgi:hypothetical protein